MISLYKIEDVGKYRIKPDKTKIAVELRGTSEDEKPTTINGKGIDNGSVFIEIDTGNVYFFDLESGEWNEV